MRNIPPAAGDRRSRRQTAVPEVPGAAPPEREIPAEALPALAEFDRVAIGAVAVKTQLLWLNADGDVLGGQEVDCPVPLRTARERAQFDLGAYVEELRTSADRQIKAQKAGEKAALKEIKA